MVAVHFDTLESANKLKASGVSEEQANATIEVMRQAFKAKDIATRQDIKELEIKIESTKSETIKWVAGLMIMQVGVFIAVTKIFSS